MRSWFLSLFHNEQGVVAPIVALSLIGLIAAGGIAFDYARLATLDTEMQQAADQAALAAAGQLDRTPANTTTGMLGSQARAKAAIDGSATALANNNALFANDGGGLAVKFAVSDITFCSAYDDSVADTSAACTAATGDADSRFVIVKTTARTANYLFTPIVSAFNQSVSATAVAGIESSICHIAPLFVCTNDANFPSDSDIGRGLLMKTGAKNSWAPGNYGYLDFGAGNTGVVDALLADGLNGCQPIDESNTAPGNKNATDAINTRFDVYAGTGATNSPSICTNTATGTGCPDRDTGKDLTMLMTYSLTQASTLTAPAKPACGLPATGNGNPNPSVNYSAFALNSDAKGMPRDTCHYQTGDLACPNGNFGNKVWGYDAYMTANHPGVTSASIPHAGTTPTRYEVYKWEVAHYNDPAPVGTAADTRTLQPIEVGTTPPVETKVTGKNTTYTYKLQCAFRQPRAAAGASTKGRRILPVLAANCSGLNGAGDLDAFQSLRVFNVFLTEPSMQRTSPGVTDDKEIYGEVVGPATTLESGTGFQYYSRNRPYLVR